MAAKELPTRHSPDTYKTSRPLFWHSLAIRTGFLHFTLSLLEPKDSVAREGDVPGNALSRVTTSFGMVCEVGFH